MERMQSYKKIMCRKSSAGLTVIRTRLDAPWGISEGVSADESHTTAVCAGQRALRAGPGVSGVPLFLYPPFSLAGGSIGKDVAHMVASNPFVRFCQKACPCLVQTGPQI